MTPSEIQHHSIVEGILNGISYSTYRTLVKTLAQNGETTGKDPSEALINYTKLNDKRMDRLDKTIEIPAEAAEKIKAFDKNMTWLILTESWCGDAAQTLPVIHKVAQLNMNIDVRLVFRDENEALMNQFLTRGTRSIPKLIMIANETATVLRTWGPRPSKATKMVKEFKRTHGKLTPEFKQELQLWYNRDKGKNTLKDLLKLLS
ncbi:MAG: thioredoxin family protein [Bacteroidota bacterium]